MALNSLLSSFATISGNVIIRRFDCAVISHHLLCFKQLLTLRCCPSVHSYVVLVCRLCEWKYICTSFFFIPYLYICIVVGDQIITMGGLGYNYLV